MYKAEILVGLQKYEIDLPDSLGFKDAFEAWEFVRNNLVHDDGVFSNDVTQDLLQICCGDRYDHIRVWKHVPEEALPWNPGAEQPQPSYPFYEEVNGAPVSFLGQKLRLGGVLYYPAPGEVYYMPTRINDQPAHDLLGIDKLKQLAGYYLDSQESLDDLKQTVVVPPAPLGDIAEEVAYLADYAEQVRPKEPQVREKNAKAFVTWNRSLSTETDV